MNFLRSRRAWLGFAVATAAAGGLAVLPTAASAQACTVTVTLVTGQQVTFDINVPAGTPISAIPLPSLPAAVTTVTASCGSTSGSGTTTTTSTTTATSTSSSTGTSTQTTTTSGSTSTSSPSGRGSRAPKTLHQSSQPSSKSGASRAGFGKGAAAGTTTVSKLVGSGGAPSDTNPSYSFALPNATAIGVPNFFIDSFQIPPFLLPIYQAAGIEYDVPWQVLAAINWIETDYGRDLSVSSAGAEGWMQFLPSTWKRWGVDATGSGYADPDNPTDAIFAAARYLQAAGAAKNLSGAIFAYNHASWYVQSVLLRAQLIGGMPSSLINALTGLVEGHFPVAATSTYADDSVLKLAGKTVKGTNLAIPVESTAATGTAVYAKPGSPVVAVNDGKIVQIGYSRARGHFIVLQDATGNTYTYSNLGSIPALYPVPKPVRTTGAQTKSELSAGPTNTANVVGGTAAAAAKLLAPATAGVQPTLSAAETLTKKVTRTAKREGAKAKTATGSPLDLLLPHFLGIGSLSGASGTTASTSATRTAATKQSAAADGGQAKQRLFANPSNPTSYAAGGEQQLNSESTEIENFNDYFSDALHLARNQYTLAPLQKGSIVVAGTILGRLGQNTQTTASHLWFQIQPAGAKSPFIDPKPILDGWKLLQATALYRANGVNPFYGNSRRQATIGEILLESKQQLESRVLEDPHVSVYPCGRRDIQAGLIDRRVLAAIEFLSASGLDPTVSGLACDAGQNGIDGAGSTGSSMDISAINNIPIASNQGPGSITDITIRRLLTLQGALAPAEIISLMSYKGQANTLALPDHANRIQVSYTPAFGANKKLSNEVRALLQPNQWIQLISAIGKIPEPSVPTKPSAFAIKVP